MSYGKNLQFTPFALSPCDPAPPYVSKGQEHRKGNHDVTQKPDGGRIRNVISDIIAVIALFVIAVGVLAW